MLGQQLSLLRSCAHMGNRKSLTAQTGSYVLLASRRRCCICYGLNHDDGFKEGHIAHINRDPSDSDVDNLAYMCLPHHNWYDTKPSQSKTPTTEEAKHYRGMLYDEMKRRDEAHMSGTALSEIAQQVRTVSRDLKRLHADWRFRYGDIRRILTDSSKNVPPVKGTPQTLAQDARIALMMFQFLAVAQAGGLPDGEGEKLYGKIMRCYSTLAPETAEMLLEDVRKILAAGPSGPKLARAARKRTRRAG
jgi:hypothetical protein